MMSKRHLVDCTITMLFSETDNLVASYYIFQTCFDPRKALNFKNMHTSRQARLVASIVVQIFQSFNQLIDYPLYAQICACVFVYTCMFVFIYINTYEYNYCLDTTGLHPWSLPHIQMFYIVIYREVLTGCEWKNSHSTLEKQLTLEYKMSMIKRIQ